MEKFYEIQIKEPVTEMEKKDFDKRESSNRENSENNFALDVEGISSYLSHVLENQNTYSETIALNNDGEIDRATFMDNAGRTLLESAHSVEISRNGLNKLIEGIKKKNDLLRFSIKEKESSIILTVQKIKKDTFVTWANQDTVQWTESRRVVYIDEINGEHYAYVDGGIAGIPVSELEIEG